MQKINKMKKGQNVLEYILIFAMVATVGYSVLAKVNFKSLKNYVFMRPASSANTSRIKIEPMTHGN